MKRFLISLSLMLVLITLTPVAAMAAGSCVFSRVGGGESFIELTWLCTSDSSGDVSSPTVTGAGYTDKYSGRIDRVRIIPATSGDQPSDNFVVKLNSGTDTTLDLLYDIGAACSNVNTLSDSPLTTTNGYVVRLFQETLTPLASGVGAAKKFTLKVLLDNRVR